MIKIYLKNPNLKGEEFINDEFFSVLSDAFFENNLDKALYYYSVAMIRKNVGNKKCKDCKKYYFDCKCDYLDKNDVKNIWELRDIIFDKIIKYADRKYLGRFEIIIEGRTKREPDFQKYLTLISKYLNID